jgi:uncharacterized BrkB/YihY/UPF0761 family membrane protein
MAEEGPGAGDRARLAAGRAREAVARRREELERTRPHSPRVDVGFSLLERDREVFGTVLSGALAFRMFLWLVPFTLLGIATVGLAGITNETGIRGVLADAISDAATSRSSIAVALVVALVAVLWTGMGLARVTRVIHLIVWDQPLTPLRNAPRVSALVLGGAIVVSLGLFLLRWVRQETPVGGLVFALLIVVAYFAVWLAVSARLPHGDAPLEALVPGAILMAVGIEVMQLVTIYLLADQAERATSVYGPIGVAAVLLFWLFVVARLVVASAVLNETVWRRRRRRRAARGPAA